MARNLVIGWTFFIVSWVFIGYDALFVNQANLALSYGLEALGVVLGVFALLFVEHLDGERIGKVKGVPPRLQIMLLGCVFGVPVSFWYAHIGHFSLIVPGTMVIVLLASVLETVSLMRMRTSDTGKE